MKTIGIILVVLGLVFLFQNAGLIPADWSTWWPAVVIMVGLGMFIGQRDRQAMSSWNWRMGERGRRRDNEEAMDISEQPAYGHEPDQEEKSDRERKIEY